MDDKLWSIWTYPWDVKDEGVDVAMRRIRDEGGLNCISLSSNYHTVKALLPHNPRRKVYFDQPGATYFIPDMSRYGRIKPFLSEDMDGRDMFAEVSERLDSHGLQLKSWTICNHSTGLGSRYLDCTLENAFGDRYIYALDPANPDVRQFLVALAGDLASRYPLRAIELEAPGYMGFQHGYHHEHTGVPLAPLDHFYLGLTFSEHDRRAVAAAGGDAEVVRRKAIAHLERTFNEDLPRDRPEASHAAVDQLLAEDPDIRVYMQARQRVVSSLIAEIAEAVRDSPFGTQLLVFVGLDPVVGEGLYVPDVLDSIGGVFAGTYNTPPQRCDEVIQSTRALLKGRPLSVIGSVRAIQPQAITSADIPPKVAALRAADVDGLNFYNYGLMRLPNLHAIRESLR